LSAELQSEFFKEAENISGRELVQKARKFTAIAFESHTDEYHDRRSAIASDGCSSVVADIRSESLTPSALDYNISCLLLLSAQLFIRVKMQ